MKRLLLLTAVLSLAIPVSGHAADKTLQPPYAMGSQGGDTYNYISADTSSGAMTVVRYYPIPTSTGLGCGGEAGFANFSVTFDSPTPVSKVSVAYSNALVDPYTWISVTVRQGNTFIGTTPQPLRGPVAGSGSITQTLSVPTAGPLTVWFGLQVAAACPNFDGGSATFSSVTFSG